MTLLRVGVEFLNQFLKNSDRLSVKFVPLLSSNWLRVLNKIVLVISHDDRYFHLANRLIKLDYGKIEYDRRLPALTC